jgi:hypothetical protein
VPDDGAPGEKIFKLSFEEDINIISFANILILDA